MRELFVAKAAVAYAAKVGGGTIADKKELDLLEIGATAIFTEDGTLVTTATTAASIALVKQFYIAVGEIDKDGANQTKLSRPIDRAAFHRTYCAYVAPVLHSVFVGYDSVGTTGGLNLPATLIPGTVAHLDVGIEYDGLVPHTHWGRYEHYVVTGDTATTVTQGLVDAINADIAPYAKWTAALAGAGATLSILITATEVGSVLLTATDDILQQATRGTQVAITYGKGTAAQIAEYEDAQNTENGDTNRREFRSQFFSKPSQVVSTATYNTYTFEWNSEHRAGGAVINGYVKEAVIAVPTGAQATSLATVVGIILLAPTSSTGGSATGI